MSCAHHWTVTSECPMCLRAEIEALRARVKKLEAGQAALVRTHVDALERLAAAERERNEALQHEGEKDARIEELLAYLRYDPETQSHFDWVGGYEQAERAYALVEQDLQNLTNKVIPNVRERAEQAERDAARRLELLREARVGVKNSAVQFGYPYTDLVDRIDAELEKP